MKKMIPKNAAGKKWKMIHKNAAGKNDKNYLKKWYTKMLLEKMIKMIKNMMHKNAAGKKW